MWQKSVILYSKHSHAQGVFYKVDHLWWDWIDSDWMDLTDLQRSDQIDSDWFDWSAETWSDLFKFVWLICWAGIQWFRRIWRKFWYGHGIRLIQMDLAEILRGDCNKSKWFDWSAEMESDWFRLNWLICWDGIRLIQTDLIEICRDGIRLIQTDLIDLLRWDQMDSDWFGLRWDQSG